MRQERHSKRKYDREKMTEEETKLQREEETDSRIKEWYGGKKGEGEMSGAE